VEVAVFRGTRRVGRFGPLTVPAGRVQTLRLPARSRPVGDYRFRLTATDDTSHVVWTLLARRLDSARARRF
jgi:hypothetical protein